MIHPLRVGKTEEQLAMLGTSGDNIQLVPGSGRFEPQKAIDLRVAGNVASCHAFCCTITTAPEFGVAVPYRVPYHSGYHSSASSKVFVFGMDGKTKLIIDTKKGLVPPLIPEFPGRSGKPRDVATTDDGHFYITDDNSWVSIHDKSGRFVSQLQLVGKNGVKCTSGEALGITVDNKGQIIVGEFASKTISIYKNDKTFLKAFSVDMIPFYVTSKSCDTDVLLITDVDKGNILEVHYSGKVIKKTTIKPPIEVEEWNPRGICCSKAGEIFVVNSVEYKGSVYRFTNTWEYTGCLISDLVYPRGISISEGDKVLAVVVDCGNTLKIFRRT